MGGAVGWMERHQVPAYLAAIGAGALVGSVAPSVAPYLAAAINPVLALVLFATFLGVPLIRVARAFGDIRFLGTVLALDFLVVPLVVWGLSRAVAHDRALLVGVLLVLLAPCVDYVIVFTFRCCRSCRSMSRSWSSWCWSDSSRPASLGWTSKGPARWCSRG